MTKYIVSLLICMNSLNGCDSSEYIQIENDVKEAPVVYAVNRLQDLARQESLPGSGMKIQTAVDSQLEAEAFSIDPSEDIITVRGGDAAGIMYGLLHIHEQFSKGKRISERITEKPYLSFRALKFNLPWDSYRRGEALQLHYETCRDTLFWKSFLDMMAENRFNKLTLWNLHPFNYLVKLEKYPGANSFTDQEMAEWENFWKSLFRMARERNIETYLINWNIFVSPEFAKAREVAKYSVAGKYFTEKGDTSEIIKDYTRESVREVIDKYPNLTGLGITLGEGMGGMTADEREEWILDSFIEGMRMAKRKIKFIHRVPLSAGKGSGGSTDPYVERMTRRTLDTLSIVKGPINIELKFNWSHGHSCTELVKVHGGKLHDTYWNPIPDNYSLAWMIRNEDFFALRWGQPAFIREHIEKNVHPWVNGYFVGSETYIPAKDYITTLPGSTYNYAFERQWMFYKLWGRLLYNPDTPDQTFIDAFESKFPGLGEILFEAQSKVSRVPLIIASYWNATWDYTLYSEGLLSLMGDDKMKLISIEQMCNKAPMDPDYMSIKEYLALDRDETAGKISPIKLADSLDSFCSSAVKMLEGIDLMNNTDLLYEVSDIRTWANLGMYFSYKLKASLFYQKYLNTGIKEFLGEALSHLEKAVGYWNEVVTITKDIYDPMPLQHYERNEHKLFHWSEVEKEVSSELEWLRNIAGKS